MALLSKYIHNLTTVYHYHQVLSLPHLLFKNFKSPPADLPSVHPCRPGIGRQGYDGIGPGQVSLLKTVKMSGEI